MGKVNHGKSKSCEIKNVQLKFKQNNCYGQQVCMLILKLKIWEKNEHHFGNNVQNRKKDKLSKFKVIKCQTFKCLIL